jgi:tripartite-type tricarboxylate transporter receptor subunit TctC
MKRFIIIFAVAALAGFGSARAQQFPTHVVRLLVPFAPGGGIDSLARPLAERLSLRWGQPVIVENKPGGNTTIAGDAVVRAEPDGYTLLVTSDSTITSNPFLFNNLPFDPMTALVPVTKLVDMYQMVVVHPSLPINSMQELVRFAKQGSVRLNYGSYGNGSPPNLLFETLKTEASIDITQVPFRGAAPAVAATVAGDVQLTLGSAATAGPHVAAGQLRALATGSGQRLNSFPDVPTLKEAGFPDVDPRTWFGVFAPAGTPTEIVAKIQQDMAAIINDPDFKQHFVEAFGYIAFGNTPQAFAADIRDDMKYKKDMISVAGLKPE